MTTDEKTTRLPHSVHPGKSRPAWQEERDLAHKPSESPVPGQCQHPSLADVPPMCAAASVLISLGSVAGGRSVIIRLLLCHPCAIFIKYSDYTLYNLLCSYRRLA